MLVATAATPNITATGVELFKVGHQTDSKGRPKSWTAADLDQIAASYNSVVSKLHDAPILDEPAAKVQVSHGDKERAYGWLTKAYREGDTLKGDYAHVDPAFAEMVNSKQYRKRSISLYPPDHPSNPSPGEWNIRHVAYVAIPAVKGLADHAIAFDDDGSDTWEFAEEFDYAAPTAFTSMGAIAALFGSLRDNAIEKDGVEKADLLYPSTLVDQVRRLESQEFASIEYVNNTLRDCYIQIERLRDSLFAMENGMSYTETADFADWKKLADDAGMDVAALSKATKIPPPVLAAILSGDTQPDEAQAAALEKALGKKKKPADKPVDMTERVTHLETQLANSNSAIAALQADNKRLNDEKELTRVTNFVERLIGERKVLPASKQSVIELALAMPHGTAIEFTEGDAKVSVTPRDRYLAQLDLGKPLYSNSPLPTGPNDAPNFVERAAASSQPLDFDEQTVDLAIRRKQKEMSTQLGRPVEYAEAMLEAGITY